MNNEIFGISCEVAIADAFCIFINPEYRERGDIRTINKLKPLIKDIFINYNIPFPKIHTAEKQNPVDFYLTDGSTLSVKSNKNKLGKVAPQNIGQPTVQTFFEYFSDEFKDIDLGYYETEEKKLLFKQYVLNNPEKIIIDYWNNLFETDHYLHFFNLVSGEIGYLYLPKLPPIKFIKENFSFTQTLDSWNESASLKYNGVTIGEFQVHKNRNCLKFRFNMRNLLNLLNN